MFASNIRFDHSKPVGLYDILSVPSVLEITKHYFVLFMLILFHKNFLMPTNFTMLQLAYASFRHNDPIEGMRY